jgi:hypothetical protein
MSEEELIYDREVKLMLSDYRQSTIEGTVL